MNCEEKEPKKEEEQVNQPKDNTEEKQKFIIPQEMLKKHF